MHDPRYKQTSSRLGNVSCLRAIHHHRHEWGSNLGLPIPNSRRKSLGHKQTLVKTDHVNVCESQYVRTFYFFFIVTSEIGQCADDPKYDCQQYSSLFNICADTVHATTACRKWCGLCNLGNLGLSLMLVYLDHH